MTGDGAVARTSGAAASPRIVMFVADAAVAAIVTRQFEAAGFTVTAAGKGVSCEAAVADSCDLIVIDTGTSAGHGLDALRSLRDAGVATPVLIIADHSDAEVAALDAGADDFVARPFDISEIVARAGAIVRRCRPASQPATATGLGDLRVDPAIGAAHVRGHRLALSGKQFDLLAILARRPGQVFTRDALRDQLYTAGDLPVISVIDVFVHGIRQQLAAMHSVAALICVRGVGFCLVSSTASPHG